MQSNKNKFHIFPWPKFAFKLGKDKPDESQKQQELCCHRANVNLKNYHKQQLLRREEFDAMQRSFSFNR